MSIASRFAAAGLTAGAVVTGTLALMPSTPVIPATVDPASGARSDLRQRKPEPLSGSLTDLLNRSAGGLVKSGPHPLSGRTAPGFSLADTDGKLVSLDELLHNGPVVLVFYLGYSCDHCVSQLFGLNEDLRYFRELGATVVAVSEDAPEKTRAKYKKYGAFDFPVLADPAHEAAQRYGVYAPPGNGRRAWEIHGTFVIGTDRVVHWTDSGPEPFTHNPTLLTELARLSGRPPADASNHTLNHGK